MYDFETNKKSNLFFIKVPEEEEETSKTAEKKIKALIKLETNIYNDITIVSVSRMEVDTKIKPILVNFDKLNDKENVLEKSEALKKCIVVIEEHLPKKIQKRRKELRKILRVMKRGNPSKQAYLQYDKLYVDGKTFVYNEATGNVTENENDQGLKR